MLVVLILVADADMPRLNNTPLAPCLLTGNIPIWIRNEQEQWQMFGVENDYRPRWRGARFGISYASTTKRSE
jgi:hypothetical protein